MGNFLLIWVLHGKEMILITLDHSAVTLASGVTSVGLDQNYKQF